MTDTTPLVSIIVITYNSSKYVLETLESARNQTYQNIELIVSDDASTDDTVEICKKWLAENKERFVHIDLITVTANTGIPANCNRGVKAAKGEWVKLIAGDDILLPNCIIEYVNFIKFNKYNPIFIHSNYYTFYDKANKRDLIKVEKTRDSFNSQNITENNQLRLIYRDNHYIGAPSVIFKRRIWQQLDGFDEDVPYEDWPFYIKTLRFGIKIHFAPFFSVLYRIHDDSIYNKNLKDTLFNNFYKKDRIVYLQYRKQNLTFTERMNEELFYYSMVTLNALNLNRKSYINKKIYQFILNIYKKNKKLFRYLLKKTF